MTTPAEEQLARSEAPTGSLVHRTELAISYILRLGVLLSITLVGIGLVLMFVHHPDYIKTSLPLKSVPDVARDFPHTLSDVAASMMHLRGQGFILVGLLVLIATPVLRVAASILAFFFQGDHIFAVVTALVLMILLVSFFLGKAGG